MPTINQLIKKPRIKPQTRNKVPALEKQPLKRGVCVKVYKTTISNRLLSGATYQRAHGRTRI